MPSIVEQLIDMGFAKERAEKAYSLAGDSLEAAMDWLISHEDDDIVVSTEKESVEMDSKVVVNEHIQSSYKCNDCNELFRDENGMMWHNIKSGHESFSETTETITPLTPEELEQKSTELRKRIKTARAQREENERKEQIEKERRRREEGKKMMETREKQKEMELRAIADERKRAKQEEIEARQRVLDQIKADKEARKTRDCGKQDPHVISSIPVHIAVPSNNHYNEAMIQIRLPNGQAVKQTFGAMEPLSAVRVWLQVNHSDGSPFSLLVPFPRRVITEDDYDKPLKELGLVPSASLVMTR